MIWMIWAELEEVVEVVGGEDGCNTIVVVNLIFEAGA
jgi:hypothetical protein